MFAEPKGKSMSKKPRPKKHYRPRAISVPPYLASLGHFENAGKYRDHDRSFLLRVANRTADEEDIVIHLRLIQAAWLLATRMENTQSLRASLQSGIPVLNACADGEKADPVTPEMIDVLARSVETARGIIENSGHVERLQAMQAVVSGRVTVGIDNKAVTDEEVRL